MADYFWGRIEIGGDLRKQDSPRFCRGARIDDSDLAEHMEDGHFVREDCEACYGQFEELEDLCRELGLPYIRQSDGKYEFSPEVVFWVPGMGEPRHVVTDHDGNMQVAMDDVRAVRDLLRASNVTEALRRLEDAVIDLPSLPSFRVA